MLFLYYNTYYYNTIYIQRSQSCTLGVTSISFYYTAHTVRACIKYFRIPFIYVPVNSYKYYGNPPQSLKDVGAAYKSYWDYNVHTNS